MLKVLYVKACIDVCSRDVRSSKRGVGRNINRVAEGNTSRQNIVELFQIS